MQRSKIAKGIDVSTTTIQGIDKVLHYGWAPPGAMPKPVMISKHDLCLDAPYQRESSPWQVAELRSNWSNQLAGVLIVSYRDGLYWVIDGKHRVLAVLSRSDVEELLCHVFYGLTVEDEARLFEKYNNKKNSVSALQRFKARLIQRDENALLVQSELHDQGLELSTHPTHNRAVKSIVAIERILERCGLNGLHWVCYVAKRIASLPDDLISDDLFKGLMQVYLRHMSGQETSRREEQLVERLSDITLAEFHKGCKSLRVLAGRETRNGDMSHYTALMQLVNRGLRNKFTREVED